MWSRRLATITEGQYRVFINFYKNGGSLSLGFPKHNCSKRTVYFDNGGYMSYISCNSARNMLDVGMSNMLENALGVSLPYHSPTKNIGYSSSGYGYCDRCGKKLRGNKSKELCYSCWSQ